jgi:hypothetical protein
MNEPYIVVLLTIAGLAVVYFLMVLVLTGGKFGRLILAKRAALRILRDGTFAGKVDSLLNPPPPEPPKPKKPDGTAIRLLTVMQREGRLLDFLLEDIGSYPNDQIGAAVRDIHDKCQAAIKEHLVLKPVLDKTEGETVEVSPGFDPSAIQLTGNVSGDPPFTGTLQHHGWRVTEIKLNRPGEGVDEMVIHPAEVELP